MSDTKISYDVNKVPTPLTNPDWYMYAQLVEMRATRLVLMQLVQAVEKLVVLATPVETKTTRK